MKELINEIKALMVAADGWMSDCDGNDHIVDAITKLNELEATLKPRPIESAPKDGTPVLILFKDIGWRVCTWESPHYADDDDDDFKIWCIDDNKNGPVPMRGYSEGEDTHWLPLPTMEVEE